MHREGNSKPFKHMIYKNIHIFGAEILREWLIESMAGEIMRSYGGVKKIPRAPPGVNFDPAPPEG